MQKENTNQKTKKELIELIKNQIPDYQLLNFVKSFYAIDDTLINLDKMLVEDKNYDENRDKWHRSFYPDYYLDEDGLSKNVVRPITEEDYVWKFKLKEPVEFKDASMTSEQFKEKIANEIVNEFLITDKPSGQHNINEFLKDRMGTGIWDHKMTLKSDEGKVFSFDLKPYENVFDYREYQKKLHNIRVNSKNWWDEMILNHDTYKEQLDKGMKEIHKKFDKQKNKHKKEWWFQNLLKNRWIMLSMILTGFPIVVVGMGALLLFNFIRKKIIERKLKSLKHQNDDLKQKKEQHLEELLKNQTKGFEDIRDANNKIDNDLYDNENNQFINKNKPSFEKNKIFVREQENNPDYQKNFANLLEKTKKENEVNIKAIYRRDIFEDLEKINNDKTLKMFDLSFLSVPEDDSFNDQENLTKLSSKLFKQKTKTQDPKYTYLQMTLDLVMFNTNTRSGVKETIEWYRQHFTPEAFTSIQKEYFKNHKNPNEFNRNAFLQVVREENHRLLGRNRE